MPLGWNRSFFSTLGIRLTSWYSGVFILSSLVLMLVSYWFVFSTMRDQRGATQSKLREYTRLVDNGGVAALDRKLRGERDPSRRNSFFARIVNDANATVYLANARLWDKFEYTNPQKPPLAGQWQYYASSRDGDLLEVLSTRLPDTNILQVGKTIQDRDEVLERFRDTLLATLIPMIFLGVAGGAFLAVHALRPLRSLSQVTRSIVDTGRFDARVPDNQTGDEINQLIVLFNRMLERIATSMASMKDALDNVAHDLRTPITRLRGIAEQALRSDSGVEACREALADCLEESDRVMAILNSLMDIAEAETGTMKLVVEDVNLAALVREVMNLYEHVAEEAKVRVTTDVPPGLCLRGDRVRLRQVVANLVDNAIKYTPAGGQVWIEGAAGAGQALLLVRDTGVGITVEDLPRIWDRLYRGDKSRSQRGLGLGLSLVKAVVQAHQGRVEVAPNPGGGSIFTLSLPLAAA